MGAGVVVGVAVAVVVVVVEVIVDAVIPADVVIVEVKVPADVEVIVDANAEVIVDANAEVIVVVKTSAMKKSVRMMMMKRMKRRKRMKKMKKSVKVPTDAEAIVDANAEVIVDANEEVIVIVKTSAKKKMMKRKMKIQLRGDTVHNSLNNLNIRSLRYYLVLPENLVQEAEVEGEVEVEAKVIDTHRIRSVDHIVEEEVEVEVEVEVEAEVEAEAEEEAKAKADIKHSIMDLQELTNHLINRANPYQLLMQIIILMQNLVQSKRVKLEYFHLTAKYIYISP